MIETLVRFYNGLFSSVLSFESGMEVVAAPDISLVKSYFN